MLVCGLRVAGFGLGMQERGFRAKHGPGVERSSCQWEFAVRRGPTALPPRQMQLFGGGVRARLGIG